MLPVVSAPSVRGICAINDPAAVEWLDKKVGILHSDVRWNNVMHRRIDGKVYGVLNDFDLAREKSSTQPSSRQRTGTRPFMSIDSLKMKPEEFHPRAHHDLESLYYVLMITITHYQLVKENQALKLPPCIVLGKGVLPCSGWFQPYSTNKMLGEAKRGHFSNNILDEVSESFSALKPWINQLRRAFKAGFDKRSEYYESEDQLPPLNEETIGGHITLAGFIKDVKGLVEVRATDLNLQL
jgi:hypothetical protein